MMSALSAHGSSCDTNRWLGTPPPPPLSCRHRARSASNEPAASDREKRLICIAGSYMSRPGFDTVRHGPGREAAGSDSLQLDGLFGRGSRCRHRAGSGCKAGRAAISVLVSFSRACIFRNTESGTRETLDPLLVLLDSNTLGATFTRSALHCQHVSSDFTFIYFSQCIR